MALEKLMDMTAGKSDSVSSYLLRWEGLTQLPDNRVVFVQTVSNCQPHRNVCTAFLLAAVM